MKRKNNLWNIPNILCFFRIALIPCFFYVYFTLDNSLLATMILIVSGINDFLDGFIARKFDMITDFGKLIDPIADKLTQICVAIALMFHYPLIWIVIAILIIKDGMLTLVGLYLCQFGQKINGAKMYGKIATFYFYAVIIVLVAFDLSKTIIALFLIVSSFLLMLNAFLCYAKQLYTLDLEIREKKENG